MDLESCADTIEEKLKKALALVQAQCAENPDENERVI